MAGRWIQAMVPPEWLCTVTVTRGGRTVRGEQVPAETFQLPQVLAGWAGTAEQGWDQDPEDRVTLVLEIGQQAVGRSEPFRFDRHDIVDIPDGNWPTGRWKLIDSPQYGQMGTQVHLRRDT